MNPGTADLFIRILDRCKAEVSLTYNPHKSNYESVESFMEYCNRRKKVAEPVYLGMRNLDRIFQLQMYPETPIGSYTIYHYDIDALMVEAANFLKLV